MNAFHHTVTQWNPDAEAREVTNEGGMTLRDYFAAKVVQSIWANNEVLTKFGGRENPGEDFAKIAYEQADTMMRVRIL